MNAGREIARFYALLAVGSLLTANGVTVADIVICMVVMQCTLISDLLIDTQKPNQGKNGCCTLINRLIPAIGVCAVINVAGQQPISSFKGSPRT